MTARTAAVPCTCQGYNPADPCGHGDTSEGCPKHDHSLPKFFCVSRECSGAMRPCYDGGEWYDCLVCGETIVCDECGQPWTDEHACGGKDRPPANWFYAKDGGRDLSRGAC